MACLAGLGFDAPPRTLQEQSGRIGSARVQSEVSGRLDTARTQAVRLDPATFGSDRYRKAIAQRLQVQILPRYPVPQVRKVGLPPGFIAPRDALRIADTRVRGTVPTAVAAEASRSSGSGSPGAGRLPGPRGPVAVVRQGPARHPYRCASVPDSHRVPCAPAADHGRLTGVRHATKTPARRTPVGTDRTGASVLRIHTGARCIGLRWG